MLKKTAILLLVPVLLAQSANGLANGKGRARGKKGGVYSLVVAGDYRGTGSATVTDSNVSLSATVTFPNGAAGALSFTNLALANDHFQGVITQAGTTFKIYGRVDLPSANDDEESDAQAVTGRVTATIQDAAGKMGRLVAIQDESSRGKGNGNGKGN